MLRRKTGLDVFHQSLQRVVDLYESGNRVVVSFSGGKDSTICLELAILAARITGNLPVQVVMRDDEVMLPGTFEYCERVAERPEVDFQWMIANQPVLNLFNRANPYFWALDPLLDPEEWMRIPPPYAYNIERKNIQAITSPLLFPPDKGKDLYAITGLRVSESRMRLAGVAASGGHLTKKPNKEGTYLCRPIYDWTDADVWRGMAENKWDYNKAYDVMVRHGFKRDRMRIAPPTQSQAGVAELQMAQQAWPSWFDRLAKRCPGVRSVANYGKKAINPHRRAGESWEECYDRVCVREAPEWIADRARICRKHVVEDTHPKHSTAPFPEKAQCIACGYPGVNNWRNMTRAMFSGDPFSMRAPFLPYVEPEFFREGAGTWGGKPSF